MEFSELVKRAKNGDQEAFLKLIENIKEKLYVTAYSYVGNKEEALDIVSEGIYRAYTSINKLKEEKYFNTWITRIIINLSIDVYNKNKKVINLYDNESKNKENANIEEKIDLNKAMKLLKSDYKIILNLKYYQGFNLKEISEILNIPLGTVKTRLNKALKILRVELSLEEEGLL